MKHFFYFLSQLSLLLVVIIPVLYYIHSFDAQKNNVPVSLYSVSMFTVLSILLYIFLHKSVKHPDKQLFISITLMNMLIKMVCSIGLLLIYKVAYQPANGKFIIPFLVVYLFFTIFETYFMVNLADQKQN
jgi:hypothetical protein